MLLQPLLQTQSFCCKIIPSSRGALFGTQTTIMITRSSCRSRSIRSWILFWVSALQNPILQPNEFNSHFTIRDMLTAKNPWFKCNFVNTSSQRAMNLSLSLCARCSVVELFCNCNQRDRQTYAKRSDAADPEGFHLVVSLLLLLVVLVLLHWTTSTNTNTNLRLMWPCFACSLYYSCLVTNLIFSSFPKIHTTF